MSFLIYELFCFPFVCFLVSSPMTFFFQQNFHFAIQFIIVLLTGLYNNRACILCFLEKGIEWITLTFNASLPGAITDS